MSKKDIIILSTLIFLLLVFFVFLRKDEDTWICKNGEWIKHGNPSAPVPSAECKNDNQENQILILNNFKEGDVLNNGDIISGKIRDGFFFEGTFPIIIEDINGYGLGSSFATSKTDWMTSDYVDFVTEPINFDKKNNSKGYIIFRKDNPSALPENNMDIRLKVKF